MILKSIQKTEFVPYDLTLCVSDELLENKMFRFLFPASSPITGILNLETVNILYRVTPIISNPDQDVIMRSDHRNRAPTLQNVRHSHFLKEIFYLPRTCY